MSEPTIDQRDQMSNIILNAIHKTVSDFKLFTSAFVTTPLQHTETSESRYFSPRILTPRKISLNPLYSTASATFKKPKSRIIISGEYRAESRFRTSSTKSVRVLNLLSQNKSPIFEDLMVFLLNDIAYNNNLIVEEATANSNEYIFIRRERRTAFSTVTFDTIYEEKLFIITYYPHFLYY